LKARLKSSEHIDQPLPTLGYWFYRVTGGNLRSIIDGRGKAGKLLSQSLELVQIRLSAGDIRSSQNLFCLILNGD
jgi:hypothetical protein